MEDFEDWTGMFKDAIKHTNDLETEFRKLLADPSLRTPNLGDRVVVAIGLLNMGHPWIREEGVVIEAGETSYKIRLSEHKKYDSNEPTEVWVHPRLITDVLKKEIKS